MNDNTRNHNEAKANTKCLDGMRCPHCGSHEPFIIDVRGYARVFDAGPEATNKFTWEDDAACTCERCYFRAETRRFRGETTYRCDNCATEYHGFDRLRPLQDPTLRQNPNGPRPSGECPACGALCYLQALKAPEHPVYRVTVLAVPEDPQEAPIRLWSLSVEAWDEEEARSLGMQELWDSRLDSTGCAPAIVVEEEPEWEFVVTPFEDFDLVEERA